MHIDGTDIIRSIPAIGQPLRFPMDISLANLPTPECDAAQATTSYIRQISSDTRFAKELVIWLIEERRQRHRERVNSSKAVIKYKPNDMLMVRVQVKSSKATGTVGKLGIEVRGGVFPGVRRSW